MDQTMADGSQLTWLTYLVNNDAYVPRLHGYIIRGKERGKLSVSAAGLQRNVGLVHGLFPLAGTHSSLLFRFIWHILTKELFVRLEILIDEEVWPK